MRLTISFLLITCFCFAQENDSKDLYRNKGYFNITRISYQSIGKVKQDVFIPGEGNFRNDLPSSDAKAYSLQTINGYFFSPYLSVGLGIGLDGYHTPTVNTLPVFIDIRGYLFNSYDSPFIFLDFGTLAKVSDNFTKGNMVNIGAGYKFFISQEKRIALIPEIGFSGKQISLTDEGIRSSDNTLTVSGLHIGLGILF